MLLHYPVKDIVYYRGLAVYDINTAYKLSLYNYYYYTDISVDYQLADAENSVRYACIIALDYYVNYGSNLRKLTLS